ncbi:MAG: hypothetical protein ACI4PR_02615 [Acutalibacteraceae bacterium]
MENKNEKVLDKGLEKVAGGFGCGHNTITNNTTFDLTQEEYDCLVDGGFFSDGECSVDRWTEVKNYLKEKGYSGRTCLTSGPIESYVEVHKRHIKCVNRSNPDYSVEPYIKFIIRNE